MFATRILVANGLLDFNVHSLNKNVRNELLFIFGLCLHWLTEFNNGNFLKCWNELYRAHVHKDHRPMLYAHTTMLGWGELIFGMSRLLYLSPYRG